MLDDLLTNKYLCIALIIALLVVLFMYSQKKSCEIETMSNVDLTPLAQELVEPPWTDRPGGDDHKRVGNRFDRNADRYTKNKLISNGYDYTKFLKRSDQSFKKYMESYDNMEDMYDMDDMNDQDMTRPYHNSYGNNDPLVPRPLDDRPDLSQCQPCVCDDKPKKSWRRPKRGNFSDSDSEPSQSRKRKNYRK